MAYRRGLARLRGVVRGDTPPARLGGEDRAGVSFSVPAGARPRDGAGGGLG